MNKSSILILILLFTTISATVVNSAVASPTAAGTSDTNSTVETNTWTQKASMPTPRSGLAIASVDGKIYAIGGNTGGGGNPGTNEMYDPTTNTWTTKATMPTHRSYFAIAVYQNKIYCMGGLNGNFSNTEATWGKGCTTNEVYDTETDTWTTAAPMPTARWRLQASVVNSTIYLVGGEPNGSLNEAYNPTNDSWKTKACIQYNETAGDWSAPIIYKVGSQAASTMIDDRIFWIGPVYLPSYTYPPAYTYSKTVALMYNPQNDSWSPRAQPPSKSNPHIAVATTGVWTPKRIYIFDVRSIIATYDPTADVWTSWKHVIPDSDEFGVAAANDKLYVMGGGFLQYKIKGENLGGLYIAANDANEQYTPSGYGTVPPAITIASPQNSTFTRKDSLTLTVNKPVDWMTYSLDGHANVTFTGKLNIAEIPMGLHNVTVYAADRLGNVGTSGPVYFTVLSQESFPFAIVEVALAVVAAIAAAALVIYLRRAKQNPATKKSSS
jgi:hypothetical protein